ncbi:hypothetical protein [Bacillus solitudinis]|uniref:hypothetical protein n=1 Tax=Bacillus solitudinis TaxID=2014074 RepID=UPI000C2319C2|nr:hypothetical protein [Bacillus solitudinis]
MKRFYKLFLLTQVAVVFCMLSVSLMQPVQAEQEASSKKEVAADQCKHCVMEARKHVEVHLDYYYELLAEKYAPNEVEKWQTIRKERDLLRKKVKEMKKRGELQDRLEKKSEWFKQHKELQILFKDAIEKRDEKAIKASLPQLFNQYQQMNEVMKKRLEETK